MAMGPVEAGPTAMPAAVGVESDLTARTYPMATWLCPTPDYTDGATPTAAVGLAWPDGR
jgi:hypothetical protein